MIFKDTEKAENFASHFRNLDETASVDPQGEGCNGMGAVLTLSSPEGERKYHLRISNPDGFGNESPGRRTARHIDASESYPNSVPIHGVYALSEDGQVLGEISRTAEVVTVSNLVEGNFNFLEILRRSETTPESAREKTFLMASAMAEIHAIRPDPDVEEKTKVAQYLYATNSIIHDGELTPGVRDMSLVRGDEWLSTDQFSKFVSNMIKVREQMGADPDRLTRIQGDFWASNIFFDANDNISIIDSRTVWGDPAIDASWMIGEFFVQDLVRTGNFNGEFTQLIKEAIAYYKSLTGDNNLEEYMHLPYAFQAFAESVFCEALSDEQRQLLVGAGNGALLAALKGEAFDLNKIEEYSRQGWENLNK